MSNFKAQQLGITAFMATNRVDFVLDGPNMDAPARVSAYYDSPKAKLKLDGKGLKIEALVRDSDNEPHQLRIKWGREHIYLGRRKNASGPVSFYRSLENQNLANAPKSAEDIADALAGFLD